MDSRVDRARRCLISMYSSSTRSCMQVCMYTSTGMYTEYRRGMHGVCVCARVCRYTRLQYTCHVSTYSVCSRIWPWASWRRGSPSGGWINEGRAVNDNVDLCSSTVQYSGVWYLFTYVKLYSTRMSAYLRCRFKTFLFPLRAELTILKKSIDQL